MTLARAEFRTQRVLALVDKYLPQAKHSNRTHTDWNVAGPALIARSAHSLRAIAALQPGQHHFDAGIILRTMFEHIVTDFGWLAADQSFNSFTLAPIILGTGLHISSEALGWPQIDELNQAFED